ncbi:hypothetical protein F4604DRAFT_1675581 [Suillus subluteus]|nr:hypothetical protein F4604DRAFT_1675581 [Suillus subluteus]
MLTVGQKKDQIHSVILLEEEVGVMIEEDKGREWGHVRWAKKITHMAQSFNDMQCHLLDIVLENTPEILCDFLADNYTSWSDFETDVSKVSASQLLKAKQRLVTGKKPCEDVDKLQSQVSGGCSKTSTPVQGQQAGQNFLAPPAYQYGYWYAPAAPGQTPQATQPPVSQPPQITQPVGQPLPTLQTPQVPQTPQAATLFGTAAPINRGNLFYGYCGGAPQMPSRGHGDTGKQAYNQQVQEWHTAHGADAIPGSSRPYPLKLSTTPLGSWECFNCRLLTMPAHQAYECMYLAVPLQETKWQETVSHLVSRVLATAPITGTPTNVQFVAPAPPQHAPYPMYPYYAPAPEMYEMYEMMGNRYGLHQ